MSFHWGWTLFDCAWELFDWGQILPDWAQELCDWAWRAVVLQQLTEGEWAQLVVAAGPLAGPGKGHWQPNEDAPRHQPGSAWRMMLLLRDADAGHCPQPARIQPLVANDCCTVLLSKQ